jgi:UDP-N-acetylmuramoyl-tripeptide--D-alanyl-D-alanine ligase
MLGNTVAPVASLNNELGVPLLILQCDEDTKYCIVEMGARHKGDITYLCRVAKPEIGVVLVVGNAHVGEFGSREKIAETKKELIDSLPENGCAILGGYDEYTSTMADGRNIKKLSFGENSQCEIRATDIELREGRPVFDLVTPTGRASISLPMLGEHNIANALAAASIATELGMSIESIASGLSSAIPSSKWRMEITEIDEISIINDSYNANTESMAGALKTLALLTQERGGVSWAILGKMHELGASESEEHRKVGKIASDLGIDHLISIGVREYLEPLKGGDTTGHLVEGQDGALDFVEHFQQGDVILVKASRAEELNLLVDEISAQLKNRGEK